MHVRRATANDASWIQIPSIKPCKAYCVASCVLYGKYKSPASQEYKVESIYHASTSISIVFIGHWNCLWLSHTFSVLVVQPSTLIQAQAHLRRCVPFCYIALFSPVLFPPLIFVSHFDGVHYRISFFGGDIQMLSSLLFMPIDNRTSTSISVTMRSVQRKLDGGSAKMLLSTRRQ